MIQFYTKDDKNTGVTNLCYVPPQYLLGYIVSSWLGLITENHEFWICMADLTHFSQKLGWNINIKKYKQIPFYTSPYLDGCAFVYCVLIFFFWFGGWYALGQKGGGRLGSFS